MQNHMEAIRKNKGWTQSDLAKRLDTTTATVSRLEAGERQLTQKWLTKIAAALGVSEYTILTGKGIAPSGNSGVIETHVEGVLDHQALRLRTDAPSNLGAIPVAPLAEYQDLKHSAYLIGAAPGIDLPQGSYVVSVPYALARPQANAGDKVIVRRVIKVEGERFVSMFAGTITRDPITGEPRIATGKTELLVGPDITIDALIVASFNYIR